MDGVWSMKATSFSEIPEMAGLPYALIPDNCHIEKEKMGPRRGNRRRTQFSKIWWPSFVLHWGRHLWCYACLWIFVIFKRFFKDSFFKLYNFFSSFVSPHLSSWPCLVLIQSPCFHCYMLFIYELLDSILLFTLCLFCLLCLLLFPSLVSYLQFLFLSFSLLEKSRACGRSCSMLWGINVSFLWVIQ